MTWAGHVAHIPEIRNVYNILVGKHEGTKPLGRPRYRLQHDIKKDTK